MPAKTLSRTTHSVRLKQPSPKREESSAPAASTPSSDPSTVLRQLPHGTRDWRRVLHALIALHNGRHGLREKRVSYKTMEQRAKFMFRFFEELRESTPHVNVDPRCLKPRHIQAVMDRWLARKLSTGTLHNYISYLHVFARWIRKDGLVQAVEFYVGADSHHVSRRQAATVDRSWSAQGVDINEVIERVRAISPFVAIELEFGQQFWLRPREARMLKPHAAVIVSMDATRRDSDQQSTATHYLRVQAGAKGGRRRDIPIETDAQRELIQRALTMVQPGEHLSRPGYSLKANGYHFYDVLKAAGVTRSSSGVTAHGLRHQGANDRYEQLAGTASPVRGGEPVDRQVDQAARKKVALVLGHSRELITSTYLGQSVHTRSTPAQEKDVTSPSEVDADEVGGSI